MSKKDLSVIFLLFLFILLFFSPTLVQGRLPGPFEYLNIWRPWHNPEVTGAGNYILSDEADHFIPNYSYLKLQLQEGEIPFWNSGIDFGSPFFNLLFIGHFYPPVAVSLLFPIEYVWIVSTISRMLLTGFFIYKLLDEYKLDITLAFMGGLVSMFALYSIVWTGSTSSYPYSAAPLFFYALTIYAKHSSVRTRTILLLGFVNLILSGYPSIIFYVVFCGAFYGLLLLQDKVIKSQGVQAIVLGILAVGICIVPLYYASQFLSIVNLEYRSSRGLADLPLRQILQMAFPKAFGEYYDHARLGLRNFNESTNYFSVFLLFFSGVNYLYLLLDREYRKDKFIWFWSIIQVWSIMMVYGLFGILNIFSKLPVFDMNPSTRLNIMIVFASIIVGLFAMQRTVFVIRSNSNLERGILLTSVLFLPLTFNWLIEFYSTRMGLELSAAHIGMQFLVLVGCLLLAWNGLDSPSLFTKRASVSMIALVTFLNLYHIGGDYVSSYTRESFYPRTEIIQHLQENLEDGARIITVERNLIPHMGLYYGISSIQSHWWSTQSQVALLRQFDADYKMQAHTQDFFNAFDLSQNNSGLDFLDIQFIVINDEDLDLLTIDPDEFRIYHFPYGVNLIENINRPFLQSNVTSICANNVVYNYYYKNNTIRFSSNLCQPGEIVLPIWNFPGWQINGTSETKISLADENGLIAVQLPPGKQEVKLEYIPTNFGIFLSIMIVSIISAIIFVSIKRLDTQLT